MDQAVRVLIIILASVLTLFLLLAIIAIIKLIQVLQSLKRIVAQAEKIADSAEAVGEFFKRSKGPLALGKFIANIAETVMHRKQ